MIQDIRSRPTDTTYANVRRRSARIVSICGLFLLSAAFAVVPVSAGGNGGNGGNSRGGDRTAEVERHANDGVRHDANDDRTAEVERHVNDDRIAEVERHANDGVRHDANDDRGVGMNEPGDDNGIDATGMRIIVTASAR